MSEDQSKKKRFDPERRRLAIMNVAEQLFAQQGYEGTSTTEIAKAADVAVGTIFKHFGDKPSLLAALHQRLEAEFVEAMTNAWHSQTDYPNKFEKMFRALFKVADRRQDVMPIYAMTKELKAGPEHPSGQTIVLQIKELYQVGIKAGALVDHPPDVIAHMMHGMVDGAMKVWMSNPTVTLRNKAIKTLSAVAVRSLCKP